MNTMKKGRRLALATAVAAIAIALSGCAATDVNTKADNAKGGKAASARVGQPVTVKGNDDGSKLQVTAKRVTNTSSSDQFVKPDKGKRLVAVQFVLKNTGTAAYDDAPSNGAKVVDKAGQQYEADAFFDQVAAGQQLPTSVKLAPGNRALGYLVFQVPVRARIAQVQFSMDSGFGQTAQWNVR
ncbi:DUF4352 domain-containing protein [Nocardioides terrisoli]|uniref:DUF4352 domain-containing protein n=1 Tax=Nocardioides terrisoli TaxID=3388267 RepID=UPI00287BC3CE|nr:DUF4352 domain-containing protein [Nocardioides marmorisolisilvae]